MSGPIVLIRLKTILFLHFGQWRWSQLFERGRYKDSKIKSIFFLHRQQYIYIYMNLDNPRVTYLQLDI